MDVDVVIVGVVVTDGLIVVVWDAVIVLEGVIEGVGVEDSWHVTDRE